LGQHSPVCSQARAEDAQQKSLPALPSLSLWQLPSPLAQHDAESSQARPADGQQKSLSALPSLSL
jgi:hypothetical protein